jgi:hypothetical protein|tara:strand:+ start:312 stop:560 length:249 start_codon:yes stop_codon:yes gene_type:complete
MEEKMYLIIKTDDFGSAGKNYSVAGHDKDRANAIRKKIALDTLNDDKKKTSYALWSSDHGNLDIDAEPKQNGAEQEAGQVYE